MGVKPLPQTLGNFAYVGNRQYATQFWCQTTEQIFNALVQRCLSVDEGYLLSSDCTSVSLGPVTPSSDPSSSSYFSSSNWSTSTFLKAVFLVFFDMATRNRQILQFYWLAASTKHLKLSNTSVNKRACPVEYLTCSALKVGRFNAEFDIRYRVVSAFWIFLGDRL